MADADSRVRSWGTAAAFTLIVALTVADVVEAGFSALDRLVIAAGVVFIQTPFRLNEGPSGPS